MIFGFFSKQKQLVSKAETRKYNYTVAVQTKAKLHKVQLALVGMDRFIKKNSNKFDSIMDC